MDPMFLRRLKEALRYAWVTFVVLGVGVMSLAYVAYGATYNFYFNNTEQGDNSTASPSVSVSDGKVTKTPGEPTLSESPAPANLTGDAAPAASAPILSGSSTATLDSVRPEFQPRTFRPWRLTASGVMMGQDETYQSYYGYDSWGGYSDYNYDYTYRDSKGGGMLEFGYFATRWLGFNVFGGIADLRGHPLFGGADLEIAPLRISLFGWEDALEAGVMLGASTLASASGNAMSLHAGARVSLNFNDRWGVSVAGRGNAGYLMGSAGLTFRM